MNPHICGVPWTVSPHPDSMPCRARPRHSPSLPQRASPRASRSPPPRQAPSDVVAPGGASALQPRHHSEMSPLLAATADGGPGPARPSVRRLSDPQALQVCLTLLLCESPPAVS